MGPFLTGFVGFVVCRNGEVGKGVQDVRFRHRCASVTGGYLMNVFVREMVLSGWIG